jgi:hypothetical protein
VIVGAYALAFHGAPRFTGDLDLFVRPSHDNGERLIQAIRAFGFPTDAFDAADIVAGKKVIQMGVEPVQLHVMSDVSGVAWDEVWATKIAATIAGQNVFFIGKAAFVKNKRASGRLQDLADIEALTNLDENDPSA